MITILKSAPGGIEVLPEFADGAWLNVVDPTPDELHQLQLMGVQPDFLTYPLDLDERARTEREDGQMLILLRIPVYQGEAADVPYVTMPLGIIMNGKWVITVCRRNHDMLQDLAAGRIRGLATGKRNRFVLHLLLALATRYLHYLRDIDRAVDHLEDQIQRSMRNSEFYGLLKYQKSLVFFTTALKANELVMERLQRSQMFKQYPEDEDLLEDVLTENQQAIEMTNIASNILSSTMDAFASIVSNNMNMVMKFLAAATIIIALPTLLSSLFGMNVPVPMEGWPWAFPLIVFASISIALIVTRFFVARDWM